MSNLSWKSIFAWLLSLSQLISALKCLPSELKIFKIKKGKIILNAHILNMPIEMSAQNYKMKKSSIKDVNNFSSLRDQQRNWENKERILHSAAKIISSQNCAKNSSVFQLEVFGRSFWWWQNFATMKEMEVNFIF